MTIKTTADRAAVVDSGYHWIPVAREIPPRGSTLQLINRKRGIPVRGQWTPDSEWTHWAPYPTFAKDDRDPEYD